MTDPKRFRDLPDQDLERLLFESAVDDAPSPDARKKLLGALAAGSAGTLASSQAAAAAGKVAATLGASSGVSIVVKGIVVAALASGAVVAVTTVAHRAPHVSPAPSATLPVRSAVPSEPSAAPSEPEAAPKPAATNDAPHTSSLAPKPAPVAVDDVAAQRELLDQAHDALNANRASLALKALNQYEASYGFGLLGHEETVLSIEAQLALGRREAAEQRAREYLSRYPKGTQASTVTRLLQTAAPPPSGTSLPMDGSVQKNPTEE